MKNVGKIGEVTHVIIVLDPTPTSQYLYSIMPLAGDTCRCMLRKHTATAGDHLILIMKTSDSLFFAFPKNRCLPPPTPAEIQQMINSHFKFEGVLKNGSIFFKNC